MRGHIVTLGVWDKAMTRLLMIAALVLASCSDAPKPAKIGVAPTATACRVTYVVDGDTLHMDCGAGERKVRLLGYDTPEVYHPKCAAEAEAGRKATDLLAGLVASGPVTAMNVKGQDRYGRDLASVSIAGTDVTSFMLGTPLALPYAGHKHPDWCVRL